MTSITYIGMDVHTTNYTICAFQIDGEKVFGQTTLNPDVKELVKYLTRLQERLGKNTQFICGYEAGCLGYTLYHDLKGLGYECVILAPTTMATSPNEKIKTDKRDAVKIAKCLAYGTYSPVYVPTEEDNAVKEYIRMRDDAKNLLKQTKQQIIAFCTRHGKHFDGKSYWTQKHIAWLGALQMKDEMLQETLTEYMLTYHHLSDKVDRYDKRIEELAQKESYSKESRRIQRCPYWWRLAISNVFRPHSSLRLFLDWFRLKTPVAKVNTVLVLLRQETLICADYLQNQPIALIVGA